MRGRVPIAERGPGRSYRPDRAPPSVYGPHQPGIATPQLERLAFAAFDLRGSAADAPTGAAAAAAPSGAAAAVLRAWSAEAERLMDAGLTLTVGVGARQLPAFAGDALVPSLCGGDLCVQACADSAERAAAALDRLAAVDGVAVRWRLDGFLGPRDRPGGNPRDPLGFRHGTANVRRGVDFDRFVWLRSGGTFLVVRRIEIDLERWRALGLAGQERAIGRHRASGAPLGARREYDGAPLPPGSHAALAHAAPRMLRRGYAYDGGLLLLVYTRDAQRHFAPLQRVLAEHDPLSAFTSHVGSAVFAIPPGARRGGYVGEGGRAAGATIAPPAGSSQFFFSSARPPPAGGHPGQQRHVVGGTAR